MQDAEETLKVSAALTDHKKMIAELYDNKFRYLQRSIARGTYFSLHEFKRQFLSTYSPG
jgi:hypothetical protein